MIGNKWIMSYYYFIHGDGGNHEHCDAVEAPSLLHHEHETSID